MASKAVEIGIGSSYMGGYMATPPDRPRGSLLLIQEIFGVTPAMRAIADDFAQKGFLTLVPDIYWRMERDLDLGNGEDSEMRQKAVDYSTRFDEQQGTDDLFQSLEWLGKQAGSTPAVLGFCLGGRLAVRVSAAAKPACVVSMYGVKLDTLGDEIARTQCPMQFHFGENDNHNPLPVIERIQELVRARNNSADEFYRYPEAEHAFYNRFRQDRFNEHAHQLARARVLNFLQKNMAK